MADHHVNFYDTLHICILNFIDIFNRKDHPVHKAAKGPAGSQKNRSCGDRMQLLKGVMLPSGRSARSQAACWLMPMFNDELFVFAGWHYLVTAAMKSEGVPPWNFLKGLYK